MSKLNWFETEFDVAVGNNKGGRIEELPARIESDCGGRYASAVNG